MCRDCSFLVDKIIPIYNCGGNWLNNSMKGQISFNELEDQRVIRKPNDYVCEPNFE